MSTDIKYQGLGDRPLLVTSQGRFPAGPRPTAEGPDLMSPLGLYQGSRDAEVRLKLQQGRQKTVLAEVASRIDSLARKIQQLPIPASDLVSRVKTALSPRPEDLEAAADQEATAPATHSVEVQWPSRGAQVLSNLVNPVEAVSAADGEHSFTLTIDDDVYQVDMEVKNGGAPDAWESFLGLSQGAVDTNEDLLRRMAVVISGIDPRVAAEVEYVSVDAYDPAPRTQPMNRMMRLKVYSASEGAGPQITLADDSGTLISDYGLDAGLPARRASVRVGSVLRSQSSDTISLDGGHVTGRALGSTDGSIDVTVEQGAGPISRALAEVVTDYNSLVSYLHSEADLLRPSLADRVTRPTEQLAGALVELGFSPNLQGRLGMALDFETTAEADFTTVRSVILGEQGWATRLGQKLTEIQATGVEAFAAELGVEPALSARRQAWALVESLSRGIIGGYY